MASEFYELLRERLGKPREPVLTHEMKRACGDQAFHEAIIEIGIEPGVVPTEEQGEAFGERCVTRQLELEELQLELLRSRQRLRAHYDRCALRIWRSVLMQRAQDGKDLCGIGGPDWSWAAEVTLEE